jgi:hypothetical protein
MVFDEFSWDLLRRNKERARPLRLAARLPAPLILRLMANLDRLPDDERQGFAIHNGDLPYFGL